MATTLIYNNTDNVPVVSTISFSGHLGIRYANFSKLGTIHKGCLQRYLCEYLKDNSFALPQGSIVQ